MLSLLRFFLRLYEYCGQPPPSHISTIASDNLALIENVNQFLPNKKQATPFTPPTEPAVVDFEISPPEIIPSTTLFADWDVLTEIKHTLLQYIQLPTIEHVKGHQDRKIKYDDLSLLAQLNVDADKAAGEFQDQHGKYRPHVIRFPHNHVQLQLTGATITSQYKSSIRYADTGPPLNDTSSNDISGPTRSWPASIGTPTVQHYGKTSSTAFTTRNLYMTYSQQMNSSTSTILIVHPSVRVAPTKKKTEITFSDVHISPD